MLVKMRAHDLDTVDTSGSNCSDDISIKHHLDHVLSGNHLVRCYSEINRRFAPPTVVLAQPAPRIGRIPLCRFSVRRQRSEIMLGVLVVVFGPNYVIFFDRMRRDRVRLLMAR